MKWWLMYNDLLIDEEKFARAYLNRRVSYDGRMKGRIIGYGARAVIVEPYGNAYSWPINRASAFYTILLDDAKRGYYIDARRLRLLDDEPVNAKPVKTYPHLCKYCKAPARKAKKLIFCSRNCSKSKKSVLASIGKVEPPIKKLATKALSCPTCDTKHQMATTNVIPVHNDGGFTQGFMCGNNHPWWYMFYHSKDVPIRQEAGLYVVPSN